MGVSTPQKVHNEQHARKEENSQFRHHKAQPLNMPNWSVHNQTLHRHLKPSYKQEPQYTRGKKVRPHLQRKMCWPQASLNNNNSPVVQLTIHVTNSRKNTEAQTRHGTELCAATFPNSSDKYPTATGQSIIMTEIKAL